MKRPVFILAALALAALTAGVLFLILTGRADGAMAGVEGMLFGRDVSSVPGLTPDP